MLITSLKHQFPNYEFTEKKEDNKINSDFVMDLINRGPSPVHLEDYILGIGQNKKRTLLNIHMFKNKTHILYVTFFLAWPFKKSCLYNI